MQHRGSSKWLAVALAAVISGSAFADADPSERERALEQRVADLERMVQQLLAERQPPAPAQPAPAPASEAIDELRADIARLDADKARRPSGAGTHFSFSGFLKHDMMYSRYSGGSVPARGLLRDFHVPGLIPVGGESSTTDFDTHIRESRFIFNVERPDDDLQAFLEFDFSANTGGDERLTNATSPNIRHAFVRWRGLLAGQHWTTFQNLTAFPETIDFIGITDGTIFVRQAQLRYTSGPWQMAIENPETTVTPFGGGARLVTDTANIPDIVLRYNHNADWGNFTAAILGRQLGIDGPGGTERQTAFAFSLSGKFDIGRNDIRWMFSGGPGIGRYLALNTANDAVLDMNGRLQTVDAYGGYIAYRHFWSDQWRSNFTLAAFRADHDTALSGLNETARTESARINLIYQATSHLRFGLEYQYARREIESGASGNLNRLQFATILGF
ncbi:MAG: DcaP family trimeric outer membrane transporter [Wenzhouxiangella sp.]